ncbi:unannotated protein [freshwater metagenome]|uniref:Unannotated protein n=1 Tax=freshwater metagenome TaxID=449393 RepID=A0A6J7DZK3_9ZZZZ
MVLCRDECTEQVVARLRTEALDQVAQVVGELGQAMLSLSLALRSVLATEDEHGDVVRPRLEAIAVLGRGAQHLGDDDRGDRVREVADHVDLTALQCRVDQLADDLVHARAQQLHRARRERHAHQRAQPRVVRRIAEDEPVLKDLEGRRAGGALLGRELLLEDRRDAIGGEPLLIAEAGSDVLVARDQPGAQDRIPVDRIVLANDRQRRVWIGERRLAEEIIVDERGGRLGHVGDPSPRARLRPRRSRRCRRPLRPSSRPRRFAPLRPASDRPRRAAAR